MIAFTLLDRLTAQELAIDFGQNNMEAHSLHLCYSSGWSKLLISGNKDAVFPKITIYQTATFC
jgi:hypothetical protein